MSLLKKLNRLSIHALGLSDDVFIKTLVNTPEWLQFIGDRNVHTEEDARTYIQNIIDNPNIQYWIVKLKDEPISIGIITLIKRDYLEHSDIGFAFLSEYTNMGYAYEATSAVLADIISIPSHTHILATTVKENIRSIKLLERLGLRFEKEIVNQNQRLIVLSAAVDKLMLDLA